MAKEILTSGQIAKWCGVSLKTVLRWIERGDLKAYQLPGRGDNRVKMDDFLLFLEQHGLPVPEELRAGAPAVEVPRALVVEDNEISARLMEAVLAADGVEVRVAADGLSAGALLVSFAPHIAIVDLGLPGIGGREVIRILRSMPGCESMRVLVVSAAEKVELERAVAAGADGYLQKPISPAILQRTVRDLLGAGPDRRKRAS